MVLIYRSGMSMPNMLYRSSTLIGSVSSTLTTARNLDYTGLALDDLFTPPYHVE